MTAGSRLTLFRDLGAAPETGGPDPQRVVAGAPVFHTWSATEDTGRGLYSGTWEATPGAWRVAYDEWEFCHIVAGESVLTPDGGDPVPLQAGDSFVIHPGFTGVWEVRRTTRKVYVILLPPVR